MQSPWFLVDESAASELENDNSQTFFGVFNRSPTEIASSIPRPKTPFLFEREPLSLGKGSEKEYSISPESPILHSRQQSVFFNYPLVSVF